MSLNGRRRKSRSLGRLNRVLVGVAAAGLLSLAVGVAVGVGAGRAHPVGARGARPATASRLPGSDRLAATKTQALMAGPRRSATAQATRRRDWLESPAARAQRATSQMAFHGLRANAAHALLLRDYSGVLAAAGANPAASIARTGTIVRYVGDYHAVVHTKRGLEVETSTAPLRMNSGGDGRPVDLSLDAGASAFVPGNPLVGLSIARDSGGGVGIGADGLRFALEGASVPGSSSGGQSVFFAGVGADTDAVITPTLRGAELFAVLRSRLSPEQLRYRLTLPAGARLQAAAGGAVVARAGVVLARISPPSARDAQGSPVPVQMRAAGNELVLTVEHRGREVAYPVLVDPEITITVTDNAGGWTFTQPGVGGLKGTPPGGGGELSITAPTTQYPIIVEGHSYESAEGVWKMTPPAKPEFSDVEFVNTTFSGTSYQTETHEPTTDTSWGVGACVSGNGGVINYSPPPPSKIILYNEPPALSCNKAITIILDVGHYNTSDGGTVSVGAIVMRRRVLSTKELAHEAEGYGEGNSGKPEEGRCLNGHPVDCATGNQIETQTDLSVGGRGFGLIMTRTYNSLSAATQTEQGVKPGPFGYGWTGSYSAHVVFAHFCETCAETASVYQDNGSTTLFEYVSGKWVPVGPLVQATFAKEGSGYVYTLPNQSKLYFNSTGLLTSEADRDGNTTTMNRNSEGRLESVSDPSGRKLSLAYNSEGLVESVTDPMGHTVKYTYESGNLASATQPGESSLRWQFKYNASHELTSETDGRGHTVTTEYDIFGRVIQQTDAMSRTRTWVYGATKSGTETTITEPNGAITVEQFNSIGLPTSVTHASGTSIAATTAYEYNSADELIAVTDPNKHKIEYGYDEAGNRTSEKDADGDETKWKYDSTHDIETVTTPDGETTTIKREAHGNPESISRPAPGEKTQTTKYKYDTYGDLESLTDPLERTWKYEYDSHGDKTAETDPEGDKRTWEYNGDSQATATVSQRGNAKEGEAAKFTTKIERDAQGRPTTVTDPLGHTTKYAYDGDGNVETVTDGNGHKTIYSYDADNELTKVEEPSGVTTERGYDAAGQVTGQTDGNKHTIKYTRNLLEEVTEVVDPLGRKTTKEYDPAGNLTSVTDPMKRTTTYTYDPANRLTEVKYSDGKTPTVKYEYNKDGERTVMTDGTGTSKYTYDQLDRLTETEDGHKEVVKYEYDLATEQTKITYPNGKAVTRTFDKAGRLQKVTDWLENTTQFAYNADSELGRTTFPTATSDVDKYEYNQDDQMSSQTMDRGSETLASYGYGHDSDDQVNTITNNNGLPGEERVGYEYDTDNRLTKIGGVTKYEYDAANDPTKIGIGTYKYNAADELETGPSLTYAYNEVGERTKTTPSTGPATTYGYDQAGNLISVERPKEGEVPKIEDSYAYNGEGLRSSQTISGTTSYFAWDMTEDLPLILSDGTNSYIYGPGGLPVEQISSGGTVTYLHHDQAGSTRLLTGSTGTVTGKCTYGAYGTPTCEGTTTTQFGYDGQYTSSDTGLIYLRDRVYDPATAQFLSVDPAVSLTGAPYNYAEDDPLNRRDNTGLSSWNPFSESFWTQGNFISESPLNPIPYYEEEISSYENGCGYLASVTHGLEGTIAGAALFAGGDDGADEGVGIAKGSADHIFRDKAGHLVEDTPENRAVIESVVKPGNYVESHEPGVNVYREVLPNGTQVWAEVYRGEITNGGVNPTPR